MVSLHREYHRLARGLEPRNVVLMAREKSADEKTCLRSSNKLFFDTRNLKRVPFRNQPTNA
jgi:hypothetical protein